VRLPLEDQKYVIEEVIDQWVGPEHVCLASMEL
jgi:hypothetical protein